MRLLEKRSIVVAIVMEVTRRRRLLVSKTLTRSSSRIGVHMLVRLPTTTPVRPSRVKQRIMSSTSVLLLLLPVTLITSPEAPGTYNCEYPPEFLLICNTLLRRFFSF